MPKNVDPSILIVKQLGDGWTAGWMDGWTGDGGLIGGYGWTNGGRQQNIVFNLHNFFWLACLLQSQNQHSHIH